MKCTAAILLVLWGGAPCFGAGRFEKVTDHCYYVQLKSGENIAVVSTEDGVLIVDPPEEPGLTTLMDAMKGSGAKPVRWVVLTNPRAARSAGTFFFARQGAMLIAGAQLKTAAESLAAAGLPDAGAQSLSSFSWLIFDRQIRLFPSNLEIRIMALEKKALTGGDVILHVPSEKVLFVGRFYEAARYPEIDNSAEGNAGTWADSLKQVVDSVPVLKPAIPPKSSVSPKPARPAVLPKTAAGGNADSRGPEITLEEGIAVVSAFGDVSNLQNMKDLLSACQKLSGEMSKAVKGGRSCGNFLESSRANIYRVYGNFDSYASQLCLGLSPSAD